MADQARLRAMGQYRTDRWEGRFAKADEDFDPQQVIDSLVERLGEVNNEPS